MRVDIHIVQQLLSGVNVPEEEIEGEFTQHLSKAIQGLGRATGKADVAVLVRQVLRHIDCQVNPLAATSVVRARKEAQWPGRQEWEACGMRVVSEDKAFFHLQANPWRPQWLFGADKVVPAGAAFAQELRRSHETVPADPFILHNTSYTSYNNEAQQGAIRALVTMPKGATLTISLPTGSGKSLCAWLPGELEQGLTVVVVPTVALSLDQEQALQVKYPYPLAYHGGQDSTTQDKRSEIVKRILANEQRILFASPESITNSLSGILQIAAKNGYLTHFVIDEAHMVYEWGNDFRASFQRIAGIRRSLLRCTGNALKTVLLSATLSQAALVLLKGLFSEPGPFQVYSSLQLRPEPSYWFTQCQEEEKETFLMEALHNLPRPLILYTSTVEDAQRWYRVVRGQGFSRAGLLTGRTTTEERNRVVHAWKSGDLDLVIGTSAFGLGIDKNNVRAVVHACVPESVDRYYQEVGRGGRDGNASVALLIYTENDLRIAKSLAKKKILTLDNGWQRWQSLFMSQQLIKDRLYKINLRARYNIDHEEVDYNENWNLKTLLLMVQAGLIALDEEDSQYNPSTNTNKHLQEEDPIYSMQAVEILDLAHFDEYYWKQKVGEVRQGIKVESTRALSTMYEVIQGEKCVGEVLRTFYNHDEIPIVKACGGCPSCRKQQKPPQRGILPQPRFYWHQYHFSLKGDLETIFASSSQLFILHQEEDRLAKNWPNNLEALLKWLAQRGIRVYSGSSSLMQKVRRQLATQPSPALLYTSEDLMVPPPVPSIFLSLEERERIPAHFYQYRTGVPTILLLPYASKEPGSSRLLRDFISAPSKIVAFKAFLQEYEII